MALVLVSLVAMGFAFLGSLPLAGPVAILVVSNAAHGRPKAALQIAVGAATAEGIYAAVAFWGFAALLAKFPVVLPISRAVTALILLTLGIYFMRLRATEPKEDGQPKRGKFWLGFSVAMFNPALLISWSAVATFLYARQLVPMTSWLAIPFGASATTGIVLWAVMMIALLRRYGHHVPKNGLTLLVRGMGVVLVGGAALSCVSVVQYLVQSSHVPDKQLSSPDRQERADLGAPRAHLMGEVGSSWRCSAGPDRLA